MHQEPVAFMNVEELGRMLGVSPKTIYYWVSRNEVPYFKVGRHLRFRAQEVIEHFAGCSRASVSCHLSALSVQNGIHGSLKAKRADIANSQEE